MIKVMTKRTTLISLRALSVVGLVVAFCFVNAGWRQNEATQEWSSALTLANTGDEKEAEKLFQSAFKFLRWNSSFLQDYAEFMIDYDHPADAVYLLEKARRIRPHTYLLEDLGKAYLAVGNQDAAIDSFKQANHILPWRLTSKYYLASIYLELENFDETWNHALSVLLTPMKVPSSRGVQLKQEARQLLELVTIQSLRAGDRTSKILERVPISYRTRLATALRVSDSNADEWLSVLESSEGERFEALCFLLTNMPERDLRSLGKNYIVSHLEGAFNIVQLQSELVGDIPLEVFLNYLLPYIQVGESRQGFQWRRELRDRFFERISETVTVEEAVMFLNAQVFLELGVGFKERAVIRPDQSPEESIQVGFANCVGVSIILADACRAVGIPARVVTIPSWSDFPGGHTWVEVYDHGKWRSLTAYDHSFLDRPWILERASETDSSKAQHRIYAASFQRTDICLHQWGSDIWWTDVTESYTSLRE